MLYSPHLPQWLMYSWCWGDAGWAKTVCEAPVNVGPAQGALRTQGSPSPTQLYWGVTLANEIPLHWEGSTWWSGMRTHFAVAPTIKSVNVPLTSHNLLIFFGWVRTLKTYYLSQHISRIKYSVINQSLQAVHQPLRLTYCVTEVCTLWPPLPCICDVFWIALNL